MVETELGQKTTEKENGSQVPGSDYRVAAKRLTQEMESRAELAVQDCTAL